MSFAQNAGGERLVEFISAAAHPDARFTSVPPPQEIGAGRKVYRSYLAVASFEILSISAFANHTAFRHCSDALTVSQPDVRRTTCALRFAFFFLTTILGISVMHWDCRHWIPPSLHPTFL